MTDINVEIRNYRYSDASSDGWIPLTGAWVRASNTVINAPSGVNPSTYISSGDQLRFKELGGGYKYAYIDQATSTFISFFGEIINSDPVELAFSKVKYPVGVPFVSCRVYMDFNQVIPNNTLTLVEFNAVKWNIGNIFDPISYHKLVPFTSGIYQISSQITALDAMTDVELILTRYDILSTTKYTMKNTSASSVGAYESIAVEDQVDLKSIYGVGKDYCEIFIKHNSGSDKRIYFGADQTAFGAYKIS